MRHLNPFQLVIAALNLGASIWYWSHGNFKLAGLTFCYAITSVIMAGMTE